MHLTGSSMLKRNLVMALSGGLLLAASLAARAQTDPASLPARDAHQGLLVAVDPYVSAEQYKAKFGKHSPYEGGVLAIDVYFRNDNDSPIRVNLKTVRLRIGQPGESRRRLDPISPEDVADRTLLKVQKDPRQRRLPFPLPGSTPRSDRDKDWQAFASMLRSAAMPSDVIPPHGTTHGFFYFDINHRYDWLSNASFAVRHLEFMVGGEALLFFEADLAPTAP